MLKRSDNEIEIWSDSYMKKYIDEDTIVGVLLLPIITLLDKKHKTKKILTINSEFIKFEDKEIKIYLNDIKKVIIVENIAEFYYYIDVNKTKRKMVRIGLVNRNLLEMALKEFKSDIVIYKDN